MTSIADTRLLMTLKFPPSKEAGQSITRLVEEELRGRLIIPSIVITEYLKVAGAEVGFEAALAHLNELTSRGAESLPIDEETAIQAGRLLLTHTRVPIADALIAGLVKLKLGSYVLSDDPHFRKLSVRTRWI